MPGWALGETVAASAWSIPLVAAGDYPPDLYVPDQRVLMRAMRLAGDAGRGSEALDAWHPKDEQRVW